MRVLTGTGADFSRALTAMRSCAFHYMGPDRAPNGRDVVECVDRLLDRMRPASLQSRDRVTAIEVDEDDLYAAGSVLERGHWLRSYIARRGLPIAPPCRKSAHFPRI